MDLDFTNGLSVSSLLLRTQPKISLNLFQFHCRPGDGTTFPINRENLEKLTRITEEIRRAGDSGSDTESEGVAEQTLNDLEESGEDADDDGWDTRTVRGREIES